MRVLLRNLYYAMIRLYPASFRSEFREEMLWIFDEEANRGRAVPLLLDAACSVVWQRLRPQAEVTVPNPYYVEIDSAVPAQRLAQATLVVFYLAFCLSILIAPWFTPVKRSVRNGWLLTHIRVVASVPNEGPGKM
ncbi:MAG TPA: hypothetical protein VK596_02635 [Edaphobacter sp.]|nr:hypothetical protein [Edaphobacter sp.]